MMVRLIAAKRPLQLRYGLYFPSYVASIPDDQLAVAYLMITGVEHLPLNYFFDCGSIYATASRMPESNNYRFRL
jgi:hypothetical protein